jgi:hypothetical protein
MLGMFSACLGDALGYFGNVVLEMFWGCFVNV